MRASWVIVSLLSAADALSASIRTAGPRAGVISRLFPGTESLRWVQLPTSFTQKRGAALRWRTAQARSIVQRCAREVEALELLEMASELQESARLQRVSELRAEAGLAESRILLLKGRQLKLGMPTRQGWSGDAQRIFETWLATEERSASVLLSQLTTGDPWAVLRADALSLLRLGIQPDLVKGFAQLRGASRLAPHAAAVMARATTLERYAPGILLAVDGHLDAVEPHLDAILARLDVIEPHLPFVLRHLDVLAPHCGVLLKHIDALLLYADDGGKYLEPLLPHVPRFAPLLDSLGPHLALLRPHMRHLLPHMHVVAPSAHRFARQLAVSANADILLWYFGWVLRIPWLGPFALRLPFMPRLAAYLCRTLPHWPVRGRTCDYICEWDGCDVDAFTSEAEATSVGAASAGAYCDGLWAEGYERKRERLRATSAVARRIRDSGA